MISTGGYQSGAIEYAKEHGIALIIVKDYHFEFLSHSSDPNIVNENDPFLYAERICLQILHKRIAKRSFRRKGAVYRSCGS